MAAVNGHRRAPNIRMRALDGAGGMWLDLGGIVEVNERGEMGDIRGSIGHQSGTTGTGGGTGHPGSS